MGALCHRTQLRRVNFGLSSRSRKVRSKIRIFLWRLSLRSLPTRCVGRSIHGCMLSLSVLGLDVWALADPIIVEHIGHTTEPSGRQWLFSMKHEEFTRMVVTVWVIWHARRKVIHEDIYQSPRATHQFLGSFVHDLGVAH
jgi:hypothetical protein